MPLKLESGLYVGKVVEITAASTKSVEDAIATGIARVAGLPNRNIVGGPNSHHGWRCGVDKRLHRESSDNSRQVFAHILAGGCGRNVNGLHRVEDFQRDSRDASQTIIVAWTLLSTEGTGFSRTKTARRQGGADWISL